MIIWLVSMDYFRHLMLTAVTQVFKQILGWSLRLPWTCHAKVYNILLLKDIDLCKSVCFWWNVSILFLWPDCPGHARHTQRGVRQQQRPGTAWKEAEEEGGGRGFKAQSPKADKEGEEEAGENQSSEGKESTSECVEMMTTGVHLSWD